MKANAREIWAKRVTRWKESGLTAKEFAAELGISAGTLRHWQWRLGSEVRKKPSSRCAVAPAPRFVEVAAPELTGAEAPSTSAQMVTAATQVEPLEVVLPSGILVRVPVRFDADVLRRVVVALEGR
jgi:transposase